MNQTLEQYLHVYCNYQQDNWSELLSLVEFAYNNAPSATTSISPFFANKEYHLNISVHPKCDIAFSQVLQTQDLRVDQEKESYIGLTQENSIENSVYLVLNIMYATFFSRPYVHFHMMFRVDNPNHFSINFKDIKVEVGSY